MTTLSKTSKTYKKTNDSLTHMNPAIVVTEEHQVFVWTDSQCKLVFDVQISEKTENKPRQKLFIDSFFGLSEDVIVPDYVSPNAVYVFDKKKKTYHVYSFGPREYPYVLKYNLLTHKCENINYEDPLDIGGKYGISDAAKTCVFGKNNEYIFITSAENELLIYSVEENKFLCKKISLELFLTNEERKDLTNQMVRYLAGAKDSEYLCKVKEENEVAEFWMINAKFVTLLTIGYKDKKFVIKPKFFKNDFTGFNDSNKISNFGCLYFPAYETVMICGGIDEYYHTKEYVMFYHIRSRKHFFSAIRLPETMAHHGLVYLPKQNWIYLIPGAKYIEEKPQMIKNSYYISANVYKEILELCKKTMEIKKLNDKLKSKSNKD